MTALFFGESSNALLGVVSQPPDGANRNHGVVLCPPIGQEHVRTHWALRQVAAALSRSGFHCLRFDWFGVGDSAGALVDASLAQWREDLGNAVQELRDTAGVQKISLVGMRVGASVAALAAGEVRASNVVLWDPILEGRSYISALRSLTGLMVGDAGRYWVLDPRRAARRHSELVGFDFGERLIAELEQLDLRRGLKLPPVPVCLLRSSEIGELKTLGDQLLASHREVEIHDTELRADWSSADEVERLLLPGDALRVVAGFLEAKCR
jgi:uncharacterized protein